MALEANGAANPSVTRQGNERNVNGRQQNEQAGHNGTRHSVADGINAPNVEGKIFY